jgi:hypothetical protein
MNMSKRDQEKAFEAAKRVAEEAIRTVDKHDGVETLHKYATKKLFIALIIAAVIATIGFVISGIANATA